jgi:Icc-related predicted phosphoesterase
MKVCAIGDPHGDMKKIKKIPMKGVELVLITGDVGKADFARNRFFENVKRKKNGLAPIEYTNKDNLTATSEIFNSSIDVWEYTSKVAPTYSILGNVGTYMIYDSNIKREEKKYGIKLPSLRQSMNKIDNFYFIRNRIRVIDGLRIGFLEYFVDNCWNKEYGVKDKKKILAAKKETVKAKSILNNFKNLDILICHQPPYGYLDKTNNPSAPKEWKGKHAGSKVILDYIKKAQPKYVFCGHIHEAEGKVKIGKTEVYNLGVAGHKIIDLG